MSDKYGRSPIVSAIYNNHHTAIKFLLGLPDFDINRCVMDCGMRPVLACLCVHNLTEFVIMALERCFVTNCKVDGDPMITYVTNKVNNSIIWSSVTAWMQHVSMDIQKILYNVCSVGEQTFEANENGYIRYFEPRYVGPESAFDSIVVTEDEAAAIRYKIYFSRLLASRLLLCIDTL
jgi:hypothetical protein